MTSSETPALGYNESMEINGAIIHYNDVSTNPVDIAGNPILISSGWGISLSRSERLIQTLASGGRRVVTVDSSSILASNQLDKAAALAEVINYLDLEKIDVIGLSEGALNASMMAVQQLEKVNSLTLITPAGLIDEAQAERGRQAYSSKIHRQTKNPERLEKSYLYQTYLARLASAEIEADALFTTSIVEPLSKLSAAGIPIAIIQSHSDEYYPPDAFTPLYNDDNLTHTIIADREARHNVSAVRPDMAGRLVLQLLAQAA